MVSNPVQQQELIEDVHASRIDPNDPRLKLEKPIGRTLKKGPLVGLVMVFVGALLLAFTLALFEETEAPAQSVSEESAAVNAWQMTVPSFITNAPDNSDPLPQVGLPASENQVDLNSQQPLPNVSNPSSGGHYGSQAKGGGPNSDASYYGYSSVDPEEEQRKRELEAALGSGILVNLKGGGDSLNGLGKSQRQNDQTINNMIDAYKKQLSDASGGAGGMGFDGMLGGDGDQNMQGRKNEFMDGSGNGRKHYVSSSVYQPRSPYEIKAGSVIPVSLITGMNSDLPGEVIAQVREHVYDSVTGNYLLIPQGSKLMARYDSMVAFGQQRALVCWNRLIRPDGTSMDLECSPGVDLAGQAGFEDQVDNHYGRLAGGVVLSSLLSATATKSQGSVGEDETDFDQVFAANVGSEINNAGQQITKKNLQIQPTIKIRPGFSVNVLVNKDLILPPFEF